MPIAWNEDPPEAAGRLEQNILAVARRIWAEAPARSAPTVGMAQGWHRDIYRDVLLPVPYYAGEVRDRDERFPELIGYEVEVGGALGVPSAEVPAALDRFEESLRTAVARLDAAIPDGSPPQSGPELHSVLTLCAYAHGEWVRIHPFANGNGRVARLWALWGAARYGLPPFVRLKPRPDGLLYAAAAFASMRGDHAPTVVAFNEMLRERLDG